MTVNGAIPASTEVKNQQLLAELGTLVWVCANSLKVTMFQQMMSSPDIQGQLQQQIVTYLTGAKGLTLDEAQEILSDPDLREQIQERFSAVLMGTSK